MAAEIEHLPERLDVGWTSEKIKNAIAVRRERIQGLLAEIGDDEKPSHAQMAELRRLDAEVSRLELRILRPHPGFPPPGARRGGSYSTPTVRQGRFEGIGQAFLRGLEDAHGSPRAALDGTTGGTLVPPFFRREILELPQRQLFVRSVIPTVPATGDKVWYLRQTVADHQAAIAHVTEALDRALLSDFQELMSFIDGQLALGVLLAEEDQILNGDGNAPNLTGLLNTAGIQTQAKGADAIPDAVYKAITKVRAQFFEPDAIVLHPNDWQSIRLLQTTDGEYIAAPFIEADPDRLWGKAVITSPAITEGTGLVGAFGPAATVYDRDQARITFTESGLGDSAGEELFTRNQVRFRGESRIAFGVQFPAAFCTVTGLDA
jgi:hypothetical protein